MIPSDISPSPNKPPTTIIIACKKLFCYKKKKVLQSLNLYKRTLWTVLYLFHYLRWLLFHYFHVYVGFYQMEYSFNLYVCISFLKMNNKLFYYWFFFVSICFSQPSCSVMEYSTALLKEQHIVQVLHACIHLSHHSCRNKFVFLSFKKKGPCVFQRVKIIKP